MPTKDWSPSVKAKPKIKKMIKNKKAKWIVRHFITRWNSNFMFFVPWILVKAWILPLPDTIQEQVDEAIGHGFDGMIVYVDQAGKPPEFYTGGWKDREKKIPADPKSLFKIASISKVVYSCSSYEIGQRKAFVF
jgi:D-alanyl-D-alanine carboxypeptidase